MSYAGRISFLVLLLCVCSSAYSDGLEPSPPMPRSTSKSGISKSDHQTSEKKNYDPTKTVAPAPKPTPEQFNANAGEDNDDVEIQRSTANSTKVLAVVAILQTILLGLQVWGLKYTRRAANAAANAAKAALEQAEIQEAQVFGLQSPYIVVPHPRVAQNSPNARGSPFALSATMRNVGPTPALNVEIYVGFQVWDGLPNVPNYNMTDHFFASDALMTSAESPFLRDIGVPESIMERLKRGGLLYLIGCFIYQDILNNMHVCGFAYKFNLTGECFPVREKSHNYHIYKPADLHKYGFAYLFPGANIK